MRRQGMLPKVKKGRRRPAFTVWNRVIKKAVTAFREKHKTILERVKEEEAKILAQAEEEKSEPTK